MAGPRFYVLHIDDNNQKGVYEVLARDSCLSPCVSLTMDGSTSRQLARTAQTHVRLTTRSRRSRRIGRTDSDVPSGRASSRSRDTRRDHRTVFPAGTRPGDVRSWLNT